jgi:seryl-tRNA(Sec) selenium transferase
MPKLNRRQAIQGTSWAAVLGIAPAAAPAATPGPAVYTRIGGKPFINLTATYTINGGALTRPEVKRAMEEASHWPVNLDELMAKVSDHMAPKLGAEAAIVTTGASAALTHGTAACVAGRDPEKMQQLPYLAGLKNEVIVPRQSRNAYDHAVRTVGVRMREVGKPEDLAGAVNDRTAMIMMLGTGEPGGPIKLEHLAEIKRKHGIPILVDAAAELPHNPNPYLKRGASLVAYSGGKFLRGPQASGLLIGERELIWAAWANASPHHAFGRGLKVGKEEIMGLVAAIDTWTNNYDLEGEYRRWSGWLTSIGDRMEKLGGFKSTLKPAAGASPFPTLDLQWEPDRYGITAGEVGAQLLGGTPRIMSHAEGDGFGFRIRPVAMKEGESRLVAERLEAIFKAAPKGRKAKSLAAPVGNLAGKWTLDLDFQPGSARHEVVLEVAGSKIGGTHKARLGGGAVRGEIDGSAVAFSTSFRYEGQTLHYQFKGTLAGDSLSGEVHLGEYGTAKWKGSRA